MVRPLENGDTYSPSRSRKGFGESYMDEPRRTPPRPASVGSPGRIADLSSIRKDPGDGMFSLYLSDNPGLRFDCLKK